MSTYLKLFETTSEYEAYINGGGGVILPNVSVAKDALTTVYFNPYVEQPFNVIIYTATEQLEGHSSGSGSGSGSGGSNTFDKDGFQNENDQILIITSHTFENGVGRIEFNYDIAKITDSTFKGCESLTSISIPNSVTFIGEETFSNCEGLTNITIGSGVTSIGNNAFESCAGLTSITIPNSVTSIGNYAFTNCSGLTSITIPNSVTSIGYDAFNKCTGLTSITIGSGVTSIGVGVFDYCSSLTSIVVDSANTVYDSRNNCNAIIKTSTNELIAGCKNTVIPNTVTRIGNYAFAQCTGLTSITIPDSVTNIGHQAFGFCTGLTSITIPDSVTSIDSWAFRRCSGLTSIICNATTAPTITSNTFEDVKMGGTLTVPSGSSGYDFWMGTGFYYLGYYNWTKVEQ